MYYAVKEVI